MKKYLLILIVLIYSQLLFSQYPVNNVHAYVTTNSTAQGYVTIIKGYNPPVEVGVSVLTTFVSGETTDVPIGLYGTHYVDDLHAIAYANSIEWGNLDDAYANISYAGNYTGQCNLWFMFQQPFDTSVFIYSNIYVPSAEIKLYSNQGYLCSATEDLCKGWTEVKIDNVTLDDHEYVSEVYARVTGNNVGNETIIIESTNSFVYNSTTERYENSDCEFAFDNKPLHGKWNWESYPKLPINSTTNNGEENMVPNLQSNIVPDIYNTLTLQKYLSVDLEYDGNDWDPLFYPIHSSDGTKLKIEGDSDYYYVASGSRIENDTTIYLQAGINWIGYWLSHSQDCDDAFGEHWDKVKYIKAEEWYYRDYTPDRANPEAVSIKPRPLHYGESYEVYLLEPIYNFSWNSTSTRPDNFKKQEPVNFIADKKSDYEVIDVINIDPSITEIGVFAGETCVGSVVVESDKEQILTYTNSANKGSSVLTFEVTMGRGISQEVLSYKILYTDGAKEYEDLLIAGKQQHTILQFGEIGDPDMPEVTQTDILYPNYPNPFNPETNISFMLAEKGNVTLIVYNAKGQKVKTLINGMTETGLQTILWNGTDENENPVSSGIYLYKLQTGKVNVSNKMILMK